MKAMERTPTKSISTYLNPMMFRTLKNDPFHGTFIWQSKFRVDSFCPVVKTIIRCLSSLSRVCSLNSYFHGDKKFYDIWRTTLKQSMYLKNGHAFHKENVIHDVYFIRELNSDTIAEFTMTGLLKRYVIFANQHLWVKAINCRFRLLF